MHLGLLLAFVAVFVYWLILERTTLGYEVRAVGFNPEAARYGGVSVPRAVVLAMGIAGAFAGLAGSGESLGHYYQLQENTLSGVLVNLGFTGIAVALLGRNHPIGIVLAAFLFAGLDSGARQLSGEIPAELAGPSRRSSRARDPVRRRRGPAALDLRIPGPEEGANGPPAADRRGPGRGRMTVTPARVAQAGIVAAGLAVLSVAPPILLDTELAPLVLAGLAVLLGISRSATARVGLVA